MIDFSTTQLSGSTVLIDVGGNFTEIDRSYFFDCVADLIDSGAKHVVVDCSRLGFLSSVGLAGLLSARKRVTRNGGRIYLTHLNARIAELIEMTKLGRVLSVFPTNEEAVANIRNASACAG